MIVHHRITIHQGWVNITSIGARDGWGMQTQPPPPPSRIFQASIFGQNPGIFGQGWSAVGQYFFLLVSTICQLIATCNMKDFFPGGSRKHARIEQPPPPPLSNNKKSGKKSQPPNIGVRGQFCLGGLRSVARKSSGFARILHEFWPENCYFKNSRGA